MPVPGKVSTLQVAEWDAVGEEWDDLEDVGGRVDFNFNVDVTEIDAGHMDIADGWSAFLEGRKNATLSGTVRYIEEDEGQEILIDNAFGDGDEILVVFTFSDEVTPTEYEFVGFVTNINPAPSDEDVTNMSFTIRLSAPYEEE